MESGITKKFPETLEKSGWPWVNESTVTYDLSLDWPKISIVTPSFNQGDYIEETIRSILIQDYPNLEYIIIDGGSTDHTVEVIKRYEEWIYYWVSEGDEGQTDAINKGLQKSSGEIFNWINSDDFLAPNALYLIGESYLRKKWDMFSGKMNLFNSEGIFRVREGTIMSDDLAINLGGVLNIQPCTFFKLSKIKELGPLDSTYHYCMDQYLWVKLNLNNANNFISQKIDEPIVNFRYHEDSKTTSDSEERNFFLKERINLICNGILLGDKAGIPRKMLKFFEKYISIIPNHNFHKSAHLIDNKKVLSYFFFNLATQSYHAGNFKDFKNYFSMIKLSTLEFKDMKELIVMRIYKWVRRFK